jgi:hypothetical protein
MWVDLVPQIPIPANFLPWVVMKQKLLLEKLALLMELSRAQLKPDGT